MVRMFSVALLVVFVAVAGVPVGADAQLSETMRVLVLTGEDNAHDWDANSTRIMEHWADWGLTTVERQAMRTESAWAEWDGDYSDYDAVVFMYYTAGAPAGPIQALADYVAGGGALVVVHSALAGLNGHEAFDELIGVGWRGGQYGSSLSFSESGERVVRAPGDGRGAAHPPLGDFQVHTHDPEHPVVHGLPNTWMQAHDELYYSLRGPVGDMHVIATAVAPNGEHAPMLWTKSHGEGRVLVTALGHHLPSIDSVGFMTTLTRGVEWVVTGTVSTPVPANFPGSDQPVLGAPAFE